MTFIELLSLKLVGKPASTRLLFESSSMEGISWIPPDFALLVGKTVMLHIVSSPTLLNNLLSFLYECKCELDEPED